MLSSSHLGWKNSISWHHKNQLCGTVLATWQVTVQHQLDESRLGFRQCEMRLSDQEPSSDSLMVSSPNRITGRKKRTTSADHDQFWGFCQSLALRIFRKHIIIYNYTGNHRFDWFCHVWLKKKRRLRQVFPSILAAHHITATTVVAQGLGPPWGCGRCRSTHWRRRDPYRCLTSD